jgi:hypothetical protein
MGVGCLLVDVQRCRGPGMAHERLGVANVNTFFLEQGCERGSKAPPVNPGDPQLTAGGFDVAG